MSIEAVIPFKPSNPKSRLSSVMTVQERELFAEAMLHDVVIALTEAGCRPCILSTKTLHCSHARVSVCDEELNPALNSILAQRNEPLLIIMADLPLVNADVIRRVTGTARDIGIGPGRGGGTNAIFIKDCSRFHVDYYGASFMKHAGIAKESGLSVEVIDSFRLYTDVDEPDDLVELFIHGTGYARQFLESSGFSLRIEKGRVGISRNTG